LQSCILHRPFGMAADRQGIGRRLPAVVSWR
jgi:hypothetical protein